MSHSTLSSMPPANDASLPSAMQTEESRPAGCKFTLYLINILLAAVVLALNFGASAVVALGIFGCLYVAYFLYQVLFDDQF